MKIFLSLFSFLLFCKRFLTLHILPNISIQIHTAYINHLLLFSLFLKNKFIAIHCIELEWDDLIIFYAFHFHGHCSSQVHSQSILRSRTDPKKKWNKKTKIVCLKVYTLYSTLIFPRRFKFTVLVQHTIKILQLHAVIAIFYVMITTSFTIHMILLKIIFDGLRCSNQMKRKNKPFRDNHWHKLILLLNIAQD